MRVYVYYAAKPNHIWHRALELESGSTLQQALQRSRVLALHPELLRHSYGTGVFGKIKPLDYVLQEGDRIELYRPLRFDPMESRRRRAEHRQAGILKKKHLKPDRSKHKDFIEYKNSQKIRGTL
ncbi:RnfH family protein [Brackiella oedipodis]|uniref:RnfH family protein n=1 Tax=Brackiella oedipodis TaxID=124225 RepID=UPI0005719D79|nr:RnfH family protein [Brackiella oedipodis]